MRGVRVVRSVSRAGYQRAGTSQSGRNVVHEIGPPFYASPPNGSNHCTRSVHIKQTPNPATLFPSPPPPILFFSVVVAASHAAFFQALPLSFSPSVVGPASNAARPLRLLPPLSSLYVFSHSLTILAPSFPSFVRQPPQSPLSGGLLRAPLIRGARGVHLLRHPPAERPLRQIRSHEKKRRRQSSGTSWPFFPSSPLGVTLHSVNE